MAILPVLVYPDPRLKAVCEPVEQLDEEMLRFIDDLVETMENSPGCVGIAAPQVGMLKRIIVIDASKNPKATLNHGHLVLINPRIERQDGEVLAREGCLSIPQFTANVKRAKEITVTAMVPNGDTITITTSDFEARVILHENDHLDGFLFLDRVSSLKTDVFRRKNFAPAPQPESSSLS
jgi:peptide deformylase